MDHLTRTLPDQIAGRYRIDGILGEGGMACVFRATQEELQRKVAIKVVRPGKESERALERMRREARAVAKLKGPHVVRILDTGEDPRSGRYIVMEYVDGPTVAGEIARGPLAPSRAIALALQACEALTEAHARGIVHRDIKPSNLMIARANDGSEVLKVADFGIAKADANAGLTLTETAAILGSPKYMSPEQIREAHDVDARSDVWSLGVVLYEMLSGRLPYEAFTASGLLARIAADAPTPLRERSPAIGVELEAVVMACLAKDRSARIQSAEELASRLRALDPTEVTLHSVAIDTSPRISLAHTADDRSTVEPSAQDVRRARAGAASPRSRRGVALAVASAVIVALVVTGALVRRQVVSPASAEPAPRAEPPPSGLAAPPPATASAAKALVADKALAADKDKVLADRAPTPPEPGPSSEHPPPRAAAAPLGASAASAAPPGAGPSKPRAPSPGKPNSAAAPTAAPDFVDFGPRK